MDRYQKGISYIVNKNPSIEWLVTSDFDLF